MGRALGLDFGQKRIGVALSDSLGLTAQPLGVVYNRKDKAVDEIAALIAKHGVDTIVLGLPRHMCGDEGIKAGEARAFGARLAESTGLPVEYIDERLTTTAVQRMLSETGMSGAKKREVTDKLAAVLILQIWLDRKSHTKPQDIHHGGTEDAEEGGV